MNGAQLMFIGKLRKYRDMWWLMSLVEDFCSIFNETISNQNESTFSGSESILKSNQNYHGLNTLAGKAMLSKFFLLHLQMRSTIKENNLLPYEKILSFYTTCTVFSERVKEKNKWSLRSCLLSQNDSEILNEYSFPFVKEFALPGPLGIGLYEYGPSFDTELEQKYSPFA